MKTSADDMSSIRDEIRNGISYIKKFTHDFDISRLEGDIDMLLCKLLITIKQDKNLMILERVLHIKFKKAKLILTPFIWKRRKILLTFSVSRQIFAEIKNYEDCIKKELAEIKKREERIKKEFGEIKKWDDELTLELMERDSLLQANRMDIQEMEEKVKNTTSIDEEVKTLKFLLESVLEPGPHRMLI